MTKHLKDKGEKKKEKEHVEKKASPSHISMDTEYFPY